ncbi:hypothetical protein Droror1_Dr00027068 [Drosera rotundifolia]
MTTAAAGWGRRWRQSLCGGDYKTATNFCGGPKEVVGRNEGEIGEGGRGQGRWWWDKMDGYHRASLLDPIRYSTKFATMLVPYITGPPTVDT